MSKPLFSVCIPTFNRAHLLPRAIDSVLAQDFRSYELVVVDNASTDDTEQVVRQIRDERVRLYKNESKVSMYENHNRCIRHARADWMVFLHSDDYFLPGTLSGFSVALEKASEATKVFIARTPSLEYTLTEQEFGGFDALIKFLRDGFSVPTGNVIARSLFEDCDLYFEPDALFADALFLMRCSLETNIRFATVPSVSKIWHWTGTSAGLFSSYQHVISWNRLALYLKGRCSENEALLQQLATSMRSWTPDQISYLLFRFACIGWKDGVSYLSSELTDASIKFQSGRYYKHVRLINLLGVAGHRLAYSAAKLAEKGMPQRPRRATS